MPSTFGGQNMYAPLQIVLVRRPDEAFAVDDPQKWHYASTPDLKTAQAEHDQFTSLIRGSGVELVYHDAHLPDHADSIFVFDPALITDKGAVVLSMGKALRRGEEEAIAQQFKKLDIPVLYTLHGDARAEGGDLLWLDEKTLAVGRGFRTNEEGIKQLREALHPLGVTVLPFDLPYYTGPDACLHLLSLISILDERLAVVYPPLMPVAFWEELVSRDFTLIEVPEKEFLTMSTNVLAAAPRECIMLAGNPVTQGALEAAGCTVQTYTGNELSLKAEGGPTCLTRPLLRSF